MLRRSFIGPLLLILSVFGLAGNHVLQVQSNPGQVAEAYASAAEQDIPALKASTPKRNRSRSENTKRPTGNVIYFIQSPIDRDATSLSIWRSSQPPSITEHLHHFLQVYQI
jgi:hypothetical protein